MSKRLAVLGGGLILVFLAIIAYATTITVNIEPNKEGMIDKSKKVNIVVKLTSDLAIDIDQVSIEWNGQDITREFLDSAASQFNESKTEVTFYYPISASELNPGEYTIAATLGNGIWFESNLIIQPLDDKSLQFAYSKPILSPVTIESSQPNNARAKSSVPPIQANKTCTASNCTSNVPALPGSSKCGGVTAMSGNPYPCCDNNGNGINTPGQDGNCTWYSWNRAKGQWGSAMPTKSWGNAGSWQYNCGNNFLVAKTPRLKNGIVIPGIAEKSNHVAWIVSGTVQNGRATNINVNEQNCYAKRLPSCGWQSCISGGGDVRSPSYAVSSSWRYIYPRESYASISSGVNVPSEVQRGKNFTISFTLKEVGGKDTKFEEIAIRVTRSDGVWFDFAKWTNVSVGKESTKTLSASNYIYTSAPTGTYKADVRGKINGNWFIFDTIEGAVSPKSFKVK
jgi:hypothetical protein